MIYSDLTDPSFVLYYGGLVAAAASAAWVLWNAGVLGQDSINMYMYVIIAAVIAIYVSKMMAAPKMASNDSMMSAAGY